MPSNHRDSVSAPRLGPVLVCAGLFILALALRLWGVGFGYPYDYHFDEPTYIRIALDLGAGIIGHQRNPTGFSNLLFCEYGLHFIVDRLGGLLAPAVEGKPVWPTDPNNFLLLLARLTSGFLGALSVVTVCRLGRECHSRITGWLAALFLAVAFLHVRDSHYATPDTAATFLVSLAVLGSALVMQRRGGRYLAVAGAAAGYAIATKWTVWSVIVPLAVAVLWSSRCAGHGSHRGHSSGRPEASHSAVARWLLVAGAFLGGFLAGGFELVFKPALYFDYALFELEAGREGGFWIWYIDTVPGWLFYLKTLNYGLGTILLGLALVGFLRRLVMAVYRGDRMSILLVSFPVLYFLPMSCTRHYFARYALPLMPFCALFGAETLMALWTWVEIQAARRGWGRRVILTIGGAVVAAVIVQPLSASIKHDVILTRQDTRALAKEWIETNIPAGAKIAMDWPVYGPPLSREIYEVDEVGAEGLSRHPLAWYRENEFDYIVASSFVYDLLLIDDEMDRQRQEFYTSVDRELSLVQQFTPGENGEEPPFIFDEIYGPAISLWQRERPGPVIKIYRVEEARP